MQSRWPYTRSIVCTALFVLVACPIQGIDSQQDDPVLSGLLEKAAAYVDAFEKDFAVVLGDESYEQKVAVTRRPGRGQSVTSRENRKTRAEILFAWVPSQQWWLVVRNVLLVDGRAVSGSTGTFTRVFDGRAPDPMSELRRIRTDSARFNLGDIYRDFNDPTLAVQFLSSRNQERFQFALSTRTNGAGNGLLDINFSERQQPRLLSGPNGDLPVTGSFLIHAGDGTVVQSRLKLIDARSGTRAEIVVRYRPDQKLGRWIPARMQESYQQTVPEEGPLRRLTILEQRIECVASYSNFRRFETSARVLGPR
jgi:hypothetical protein